MPWVARVAVSGHFMQIFALPQVIAMIEKFIAVEIEHEPATVPCSLLQFGRATHTIMYAARMD